MELRGRNHVRAVNAPFIRELFAKNHLSDWDVVHRTGLNIATVKNIQRDGGHTIDAVIQLLTMSFPVKREDLILSEDETKCLKRTESFATH